MLLTTAFRTPLFERPATTINLSLYAAAAPDVQAVVLENYATAAFAVVELNGHLRFHASPIIIRGPGPDNRITSIVVNGSNTEFAPRSTGHELFTHFVTILTRRACPTFAIKGAPLTEEQFVGSGMPYAPNTYLAALPRAIPIPFGKDWVEGDITDPAVTDLFRHEYGDEHAAWLQALKGSLVSANTLAAAAIFTSLSNTGDLGTALGALSDHVMITPEPAVIYSVSINDVTHPADYATIKDRLTPNFITHPTTTTAPVTPMPAGLAGFTPADFAAALSSRDEKKESNKLRDGFHRMLGLFVKGTFSFKRSTLSAIEMPTPTAAYEDANSKTSLDERTEAIKRLADTSNQLRPRGPVVALAANRSMPQHDSQLCRQLALANWSAKPVEVLSMRPLLITIFQFAPHTNDDASIVQAELEESEARATLPPPGERRLCLISPPRIWGIDAIKRLVANFVSLSDALWVYDEARPIITEAMVVTFDYLHEADFLEYYTKLSRDDRENFTYHLLSRLDLFVCRMVRASNEYSTHAAITAGKPEDIDLTAYAKAFTGYADDFDDMKRTVNRGNKFATVSMLRPSPAGASPNARAAIGGAAVAASSSPKKARVLDAQAPVLVQAPAPAQAPRNLPPGHPAGQPRVGGRGYDIEHGRRMGDFVVRDGFSTIFATNIADKFCPGFSVLGQACGRSECTKVHLPFGKWSADDQSSQLAHVAAHHPAVAFNRASVRNLPEDKRHLLSAAPAPAGM